MRLYNSECVQAGRVVLPALHACRLFQCRQRFEGKRDMAIYSSHTWAPNTLGNTRYMQLFTTVLRAVSLGLGAAMFGLLLLFLHSFYIALFSALEQTHCAHVACDSE